MTLLAKGLPKWAIKKAQAAKAKNVFAYAWSLVKKTRGKATKTLNPEKRTSNKEGSKRMAKKPRRRSSGMTIPLAPMVGLAVGLTHPIQVAMQGGNSYIYALEEIMMNYTGFDNAGHFDAGRLTKGVMPLVVGLLVHKFVGGKPLNFNGILGKAKIPFVRI